MQAYQQRVIDEKAALDEKLVKLEAFIDTSTFSNLPLEERARLISQRRHMKEYSKVLGERIAAFPT